MPHPISSRSRASREARQSALAASPGRREEAVAKAVREAVFRFLLVLRINVTAQEQLDREVLIRAALTSYLAALASFGGQKRDDHYRSQLRQTCARLIERAAEMEAWSAARARRVPEQRHLAGRLSLLPDLARAHEEQLQTTRECGQLATHLAELEGLELGVEAASAGRIEELLADLVEPSKAIALEKLGEGERGLPIAVKWLRAKCDRSVGE